MTNFKMTRRSFVASAVVAPFVLKPASSSAATPVKFSLAAPFDGSNAAFFLAQQSGWYRDAGLECQFDAGAGSGEAVSRVGSGVYDAGIADINTMAEFNAKNAGATIRNVYMVYFRSPLCVGTLAKSGIAKPADLDGRTIGAAAPDGAYRLFSTYAKAASIDPASVKWNMVGLQLREAVLAGGDADAILGFDSTMYFGLKKAGINPRDIKFYTTRMSALTFMATASSCRKNSGQGMPRRLNLSSPSAPVPGRPPRRIRRRRLRHSSPMRP